MYQSEKLNRKAGSAKRLILAKIIISNLLFLGFFTLLNLNLDVSEEFHTNSEYES